MCKYIGHDSYTRGRVVDISDIGRTIENVFRGLIAAFFAVIFGFSIIEFMLTSTLEEKIAMIVMIIAALIIAGIFICIMGTYNKYKDVQIFKCKR